VTSPRFGPNSGRVLTAEMCARQQNSFWDRVVKSEGCWTWTGARLPITKRQKGYGTFAISALGRPVNAHRIAYALTYGEVPAGRLVMHRCDNPICVNPAHLMLGTHADNMADMDAKGRRVHANTYKTHCINGHPLSDENVRRVRTPAGSARMCRICERARLVAFNEAKQAQSAEAFDREVRSVIISALDADSARAASLRQRDLDVITRFAGYHRPCETLVEIAASYGITPERARQIRDRALRHLGVDSAVVRHRRPPKNLRAAA